jgi:D-lactate dehydrogenase (cytochrome)
MPYALGEPWHVLLELGAAEPARDLRTPLETLLAAALEAGEASDAVIAESGAQRAAFWKIRETLPDCVRQDGIQVSTDTAVPVSRVPEFLARCLAMFAARWPEGRAIAVGHLGDGNIHVGLLGPKEVGRAAWQARTVGLEEAVNRLAAALGGSFSAEHGIGVTKLRAMAALKPARSARCGRSRRHSTRAA